MPSLRRVAYCCLARSIRVCLSGDMEQASNDRWCSMVDDRMADDTLTQPSCGHENTLDVGRLGLCSLSAVWTVACGGDVSETALNPTAENKTDSQL